MKAGETVTFLSKQTEPDAFTAEAVMSSDATIFAIPVNGFNFAIESTSTSQSTSSSQSSPTASTLPILPVASTTPPSTTSLPSEQQTSTAPTSLSNKSSSSPPLGETVGISVGVVLVVLVAALVAFLGWRRRKRARQKTLGIRLNPEYQMGGLSNNMDTVGMPQAERGSMVRPPPSPKEMPTTRVSEIYEI